jgi:ubiquinone/menaquinone biosynthesis C-methylase UbiE
MTTNDEYAQIAPFYDLEFDEFTADVDLYLGYAQLVGGPVLELGCGTGRLIGPLADTGFQVTGVDNSSSMIDLARARLDSQIRSGSVELLQSDMRSLDELGDQQFRLIFVAVNSFLHLESQQDQLQALGQIRKLLDRDGLLILDVFNPTPETLARMTDRYAFDGEWSVAGKGVVQRFSSRQLDSANQTISTLLFYDRVSADGNVMRLTTSYVMRYVHRFELELLLATSGFEIEGIYGSYGLDPIDHDSEQIIAVSHRTANPGED